MLTFPDSMLTTVNVLRTALAQEEIEVGTRVPTNRKSDSTKPFVMVRLDAVSLMRDVVERATLRVSVWHSSEYKALELAQKCRNLLLDYQGDSSVSNYRPGSGPIPASDPESASPLSYFTISAHLKPTNN